MIEAKGKDPALFRLMEDIESVKWIRVLNGASIGVSMTWGIDRRRYYNYNKDIIITI